MAKQNPALDYVRQRVEPGGQQAERRPLEQTWFGNLAYYSGTQYFIEADGTIRLPRRPSRRSRYKANLIAPNVLRNVARLSRVNMDLRVAPNSPAIEDREAARVADKVWEHIQAVNNMGSVRRNALLWAAICGAGYIKVTWDPLAGVPNRVYRDEESNIRVDYDQFEKMAADEDGRFEDTYPGDVYIECVSPFQFHWDWTAREEGIRGCAWVAQVQSVPVEWLVDRYGTKVRSAARAESTDAGSVRYEEAIATMSAGMYGINLGQYPHQLHKERVRVIEFFEIPMKQNKNKGRYILEAGGQVLRDEENPYVAFGCPLPFAQVGWWPMPGRFTSLSLVEQLRAPQRAYNESRSHQHDVERTNGYPITFLPTGSGVKKTSIVGHPGLVLEMNMQGPAPITTNPPNLPPFIGENASRAREELNAISAMASPSKDAYPAGVRSSLAINAIQEDNNAILNPTVEMLSEAMMSVGRMALQIASSKYDTPRMIRTVGKGGDYEVEYFASADLRGHHDIRVFGEPTKLETSASHLERLLTMIELGVLRPNESPEDKVAVLKAMDSKTSDEILNDQLADERQEEKWLRRMVQRPGFQPPLLGPENPQVRVKVLERVMKRDEFFEYAEATQQAIMQRWQTFQQLIAQQMEAQLEIQAQLSGSQKNEKGTPSAPRRRSGANT